MSTVQNPLAPVYLVRGALNELEFKPGFIIILWRIVHMAIQPLAFETFRPAAVLAACHSSTARAQALVIGEVETACQKDLMFACR